jgi:hypothetical protein
MTINITQPQGNVFCILGYAKNFHRQLQKHGIANQNLNEVLSGYTEMTYDEILDKLSKTGLFKFTGRKKLKE